MEATFRRAAESDLLAFLSRAAAILSTMLLTAFGWQASTALSAIQALQQQQAIMQTTVKGHASDIAALKTQAADVISSRATDRADAAATKARLDAINSTLDRLERLIDTMKKTSLNAPYSGG